MNGESQTNGHVYRVGIIGCGRMASTVDDEKRDRSGRFPQPATLAEAYRQAGRTEVVAVADIDQAKLDAFSARWGVHRLYTDYHRMLENEDLDIVSVATHADLHCEMTVAAAGAGVRGVLCEKAMAISLPEADQMIAACREAGTTLTVHFHNRWDPLVVKTRDLIVDGAIGSLISVTGTMGPELVHEGGHLFDLLRMMVGADIAWVFGQLDDSRPPHLDPGGSGYVQFTSGVHAFVNAVTQCPVPFEFDFIGTEGRIRLGYGVDELWTIDEEAYEGRALVGRKIPQNIEARSGTVKAIEELVACIADGKGTSCSGEDGRAALEAALAFHHSHLAGGAKISLPLVDATTIVSNSKYQS